MLLDTFITVGTMGKDIFHQQGDSMIPEKVQIVLRKHGLKALEFEPGSTPTAEMAAHRIGVATAQIAKSILMRGKDGHYRMIILPGDRKISASKLKKVTGVKHSMASAEETGRITGFPPGGVCPFGIDGIEILLDARLSDYETIYPAAGNDATGVPVTFDTLKEITGGTCCDISV
jgi:prolyl-tRNA editing enzyme YbaK/EbsC (Cys-tRNA(Pro) deacylase)